MSESPRYGSAAEPGKLLQQLRLPFAGRSAQNRFLKAAMTERLASWDPKDHSKRGVPSSALCNLYKRWGEGQFGIILTGNIMVDTTNMEAPGNLVIPVNSVEDSTRLEAWRKLAASGKEHGSLMIGQISHPGRQVSSRLQSNPVSASDIGIEKEVFGMTFAKPHAATKSEIASLVEAFTHAAVFLHRAGFDGIQIHGAHGYLLAQFLAVATNKRTDEYGGSLRNRSRIIAEIAKSIRKAVPSSTGFVLGIKLNSVEFEEGGFGVDECAELCTILEQELQFDFVELSGGTYESIAWVYKRESTKKREAFFLEFADKVVPSLTQTKLYVTGGFKTVAAMADALQTIDGVGIGRPACAEPLFPRQVAEGQITTGAYKQAMDEYDYGTTETVAGTQMQQISKNQVPMDMTEPSTVEAFKSSMAKWEEELAADAVAMRMTGYVNVDGISLCNYSNNGARL